MKETLRPVAVLTGICLIVAVLLAATNGVTAPIIAANEAAAAQQTRIRLLPEADSFDIVPVEAEGVTEAARAANGAGWVITAQAQGYGGQVPVMVAFGQDGAIRAVEFLANDETPGLGQKVRNESFGAQFSGTTSANAYEVDAISGATVSSNAAILAVEHACAAYDALAGAEGEDTHAVQEGGGQA